MTLTSSVNGDKKIFKFVIREVELRASVNLDKCSQQVEKRDIFEKPVVELVETTIYANERLDVYFRMF